MCFPLETVGLWLAQRFFYSVKYFGGGDLREMPSRDEKQKMLNEIREKLKDSKIAIMADFRGLDVASMNSLRRKLREIDGELKVAKNTLTSLAATEIGLKDLDPILEGPTAIAFCKGDPVKPAKLLIDLTREFKQLVIKGGILEGKVIQDKQVRQISELPSREIFIGQSCRRHAGAGVRTGKCLKRFAKESGLCN